MNLTEEQINEVEVFISTNKPRPNTELRVINSGIFENRKQVYNEIKDHIGPIYRKFGTENYRTYALYKSKNEQIYLISIHFQSLSSYIIIENELSN